MSPTTVTLLCGLSAAVFGLFGAFLASVAPRKSVAIAALEAAITTQARQITNAESRILALEAEVQDCERGRAADREQFTAQIAELYGRLDIANHVPGRLGHST